MWDFQAYYKNIAVIGENSASFSYYDLEYESREIAKAVGGRSLLFCLCKNAIGALAGYISFLNKFQIIMCK